MKEVNPVRCFIFIEQDYWSNVTHFSAFESAIDQYVQTTLLLGIDLFEQALHLGIHSMVHLHRNANAFKSTKSYKTSLKLSNSAQVDQLPPRFLI